MDHCLLGSRTIKFSLNQNFRYLSRKGLIDARLESFIAESKIDSTDSWFDYTIEKDGTAKPDVHGLIESWIRNIPNEHFWRDHWHSITGKSGGSLLNDWLPDLFSRVHPLQFLKTQADMIPALRTVSEVKHEGLS